MNLSTPLSAEIITTGTEILLGDIVDTNAAWIAQQMREVGVNLYFKTTVGDNEPRIRGVLEQSLGRSDLLLVTGGLGPTADDITRDAIANATGRPLVRDEAIVEKLRERFARWGNTMTENNLRQAFIPEGATVIPNPVGTAPGFIAQDLRNGRGARVIAMPGVPREMKRMITESVLPFVLSLTGGVGIIRRRILRTVGIGESALDSQLGDLMNAGNPTVGLAAHTGQADIRIAARAASADEAERLLDQMEAQVRERMGQYIYSATPDESVEAVLVRLLQEAGATLALLEGSSGGAIVGRLRGVEGGSERILDVNIERSGWQSDLDEEQAGRLACTARDVVKATFGLVVLSTGGVDEDFYSQTPGQTWLALAGPTGVRTARFPFGGRDNISTVWIGNRAMDLLRRELAARS
ncbi:MAG: CinA family nicotinamide mononucleotide deamidase-related protein [Caldilineaceae bacterium]|nr:CinA family nicotinamide mononucleotide deamidase-related protein [Caldilineaceae bacterium]HRJ42236.1 CinA family nicotinamide mononucleotide deamidase-related protein [Caldilineaceae bacterium]